MLRRDVNNGSAWRFSFEVKYSIHGFAFGEWASEGVRYMHEEKQVTRRRRSSILLAS